MRSPEIRGSETLDEGLSDLETVNKGPKTWRP